jgi:hypothetical protein
MKAWHHIPFGHIIFAGPQRHVAAAGRSVSHCDRAGLGVYICPLACANPTDMTIASKLKVKVLSMFCSSLVYTVELYGNAVRMTLMWINGAGGRPPSCSPKTRRGGLRRKSPSCRSYCGGRIGVSVANSPALHRPIPTEKRNRPRVS